MGCTQGGIDPCVGRHTGPRAFRAAADSPINLATDDLGTLGGTSSSAFGINVSGQVVGWAYTTGDTAAHAFRTASNSPINAATDDLGTLGGTDSVAYGINASGQVVGYAYTSGNAVHAFRTSSNSAINPATDDLGTLGGTNSYGIGINASGQAVGWANTTGDVSTHAFLYSGGVIHDLNDLIPAGSGWELTQATAINDAGQITGYGYINGLEHAFLLSPPAAVADLAIRVNGARKAKSGGTLNYAIVVQNNGPQDANHVTMVDEWSIGFQAYRWNFPSNVTCDFSPTIIKCDLGTIAAGGGVSITVQGL